MASLVSVNTSVSGATEIPEVWAQFVEEHRDANLTAGKFFMDFSQYVSSSGDVIHIPQNLIEQTPATFTEGQRLTDKLQADTESETTITLDTYKVNPFVVSDQLEKQSAYLSKALKYKKAAYAIAKQIDSQILAHSSSFTTTQVNNGGTTITNLDVTEAWTRLNANNVPDEDRQWFFHPWAIKDLYDLSGNYFVSMDFAEDKPLVKGWTGRAILGSPVVISTNVPTQTTGSPAVAAYANIYAHKEAIYQAHQFRPGVQESKPGDGLSIDIQGVLCNVRSLYGTSLGRGDHGVVIDRENA